MTVMRNVPPSRGALCALLAVIVLVTAGCAGVAQSTSDARKPPPGALGAAEVDRGQVFAQRDTGALALDLYLPARSPQPAPLVVYAHGGGWDAGDRHLDGDMLGSAESLTAQALVEHGYAVATVDYRLSEIAPAPAQVLDVSDAVRWLQQDSGRWNLDPNRVALWGESAGGQIVSQLGAVAADPTKPGGGLSGIRGVVDWFGPTDVSPESLVHHPELKDYARRVLGKYLGCAPTDCPSTADQSSPSKNLSGAVPPFLIQHGTADSIVPIDQSLNFAAELRRRGVPVALHPYEGIDHGFPRGTPMTSQIVDTVVAFVEKTLPR
jgi:acetyl esterase/lipase